jgi:hypothetical protein
MFDFFSLIVRPFFLRDYTDVVTHLVTEPARVGLEKALFFGHPHFVAGGQLARVLALISGRYRFDLGHEVHLV